MAYLSLYRKYRPQTFAQVIGQDHVTRTLARAVDEGRQHHAYLFTGPRGTGKTSTARILAMAVNATDGPTSTPDPDDALCRAIAEGRCIDVLEIDAASHNGVDDVRELRDRVTFAPAQARTKVYIVDECHMLSTQAWNAFLKTVEEPPGHVLFVFATTEPHKVPATILSRTQRFDLRRVPARTLAEHGRDIGGREGVTFGPGAVELLVRAADGSVRDLLSVMDQVIAFAGTEVTVEAVADVLGTVPAELLDALAATLADGDVAGVLTLVGRVTDAGRDLRQFAQEAVEHLRSLLLLQVAPTAGLVDATPERVTVLAAQADRLGRLELLRAVELLGDCQTQMRRGNTRLPLEIALAKAALPEASGDAAALGARLDRLERGAAERATPTRPEPVPAGVPDAPPQSRAAPEEPTAPTLVPDAAPPPPPAAEEPSPPQAPEEPAPPPAEEPTVPAPVLDAAPPPPTAAGPGLDLPAVQRVWEAVVETTKEHSRRVSSLLAYGRPSGIDGAVVTLTFPFEFHAAQCDAPETRKVIEEVFTRALHLPVTLRCTVAAEAEVPGAPPPSTEDRDVMDAEAEAASGRAQNAEEAHRLAVQTLQRDLGAVLIDED